MERNVLVLVPSDMSGKPVSAGLARTFDNCRIRTVNLCDEIISDYSSSIADKVFSDLISKAKDVGEESLEKGTEIYVLCGGAVVNAVMVAHLFSNNAEIKLLVWEKKIKKYVVFDFLGRRLENGSNCRLVNKETENSGSEGKHR